MNADGPEWAEYFWIAIIFTAVWAAIVAGIIALFWK